MIAAWLYGGPGVAQKAIVVASDLISEAFSKYTSGIITDSEFQERITKIQEYLESKRSVFGRYPEYSNKLFTTPIRDLRESIGTASKLLISGVLSLSVEIFSVYMSIQNWDKKWQVFASGLSAGLGVYTFYRAMKNKIILPGPFELMDKIGFGATVISIFASGAQIGYLLGADNGGS